MKVFGFDISFKVKYIKDKGVMSVIDFFIRNHNKIDLLCSKLFLYCVGIIALIVATEYLPCSELCRVFVVLATPFLMANRTICNCFLAFVHRTFRLEE